jgi:ElaB/YqjD/DUF883 family membrane-anchored ribosome-binding protein
MANTSSYVTGQGSTEHEGLGTSVSQSVHPACSPAESLANMATEKAKNLASSASNLASEAKETVQEWSCAASQAASRVKVKAQEFASTAAHRAESLGEDATTLIRRYPVQALLIGFGAGFLLSRLRRR